MSLEVLLYNNSSHGKLSADGTQSQLQHQQGARIREDVGGRYHQPTDQRWPWRAGTGASPGGQGRRASVRVSCEIAVAMRD